MAQKRLAAEAALLEWVNSLSAGSPATNVSSLTELRDGIYLWKVLRDIDPDHFKEDLPEPQPKEWLPRWQNMKHVQKALSTYVRDKCNLPLPEDVADINAIATDGSVEEMIKLVKLVVAAAINSPNTNHYIEEMIKLSESSQVAIKEVIEEVLPLTYARPSEDYTDDSFQIHTVSDDNPELTASNEPSSDVLGSGLTVDRELVFEERIAQLLSDNDGWKRKVTELEADLHEFLQTRLAEAEDREAIKARSGDHSTKALEAKLQNQEELIARQEIQLADQSVTIDSLEKTGETLRAKADKAQKLRDELDVVKIERDNFAKKANTVDKYKQKLQASQDIEKDNRNLRNELEEIRAEKQELGAKAEKAAGYQLALSGYKKLIERLEQDNFDALTLKKQLEFDNMTLSQRLQNQQEQSAHDERTIALLQERNRELESGITPQPAGDLQSELDTKNTREKTMKQQISMLKSQVEELNAPSDAAAQSVVLQELLEDANQRYDTLNQKHMKLLDEKLGLENTLKDVHDGNPVTRHGSLPPKLRCLTDTFTSSERYYKMNEELLATKNKLSEIQKELEDTKSELETAKADLSLVGKDKLDVLEELKKQASAGVDNLQGKLDNSQERMEALKEDLKQHKALLRDALHEKSQLQKALEFQGNEAQEQDKEVQRAIELIKAASPPLPASTNLAFEKQMQTVSSVIETGRQRLAKRAEYIKKQNTALKELQMRLKEAEEDKLKETASEAQLKAQEQEREELRNLQRENALIVSAWYDLTTRIQSNNVTVQRFKYEPRSFLHKQRQMLNTLAIFNKA
ncbi:MAG: hypothetical protein M1834_005760 [Cirrosporium novae-zelandiae]|nr:MAG: hypothetical protein M1834_005760 [Cirrosporium novae-zelandiae]